MESWRTLVTLGIVLFAFFLLLYLRAFHEKKRFQAISYLIPLVIIGGGTVLIFLSRPQ